MSDKENSPMGSYEHELIRHIAAKSLVESDEINIEEFDRMKIETALWAAASQVAHGLYQTHPSELEYYQDHPEVKND